MNDLNPPCAVVNPSQPRTSMSTVVPGTRPSNTANNLPISPATLSIGELGNGTLEADEALANTISNIRYVLTSRTEELYDNPVERNILESVDVSYSINDVLNHENTWARIQNCTGFASHDY